MVEAENKPMVRKGSRRVLDAAEIGPVPAGRFFAKHLAAPFQGLDTNIRRDVVGSTNENRVDIVPRDPSVGRNQIVLNALSRTRIRFDDKNPVNVGMFG